MAKFIPYKYIKEAYNPDRLVMPAIRDQILNTIFLGKSEQEGETLLDNQNYPFFDLWAYCINHYKYSFYETPRSELLVVPDMMSCVPPMPNVVFTDEYVHYGRNIQLRGLVTRLFEQGFHTTHSMETGEGLPTSIEMAQEAFVAPTSDVVPEMGDVIRAECTPIKVDAAGVKQKKGDENVKKEGKTEKTKEGFTVFRQVPLSEEFHYGVNIKTGAGEYLLRMGENLVRKNFGSSISNTKDALSEEGESSLNLVDEYNNYHKLNVLYKYFMTRLQSQKTPQVRLTFTPRLIPGLPILLLSRTGRHSFGLLTSLSHIIDAKGVAETQLTVEYQYIYDDVTKRPIYFYRDKVKIAKNIEKGKDDSLIWKNYFMLSTTFRDKYIGREIYKKIIFDGISSKDYNAFSTNWKNMQDKSILGIHERIKSTKKSKTKQKNKKLITAKEKEVDDGN